VFLDSSDLDVEVVLDDSNVDLIEAGITLLCAWGHSHRSAPGRARSDKPGVCEYAVVLFEGLGAPWWFPHLVNTSSVIYDVPGGGSDWTFRKATPKWP